MASRTRQALGSPRGLSVWIEDAAPLLQPRARPRKVEVSAAGLEKLGGENVGLPIEEVRRELAPATSAHHETVEPSGRDRRMRIDEDAARCENAC